MIGAIEAERCRRSAHHLIFDSRAVLTKDEHDPAHPVKPVPDLPYLRVLLDCYLVSGRLLEPEDATSALAAGVPLTFLVHAARTGLLAVEKSRDMFVTNLTCCYLMWRARSLAHQLILVQSQREENAAALVFNKDPSFGRLSFMESHLPGHLRQLDFPKAGAYANLYYPNGSHVRAIPEGGSIIRTEHPSIVFSDEAAHQPDFGDAHTAALPAVEGGGQLIAVSSAYPGQFEEIVEGEAELNPSRPTKLTGLSWRIANGAMPVLRLHYSADPAKRPGTLTGEAWREETAKRYAGGTASPRWRQEMEIEYRALSGQALFPDWEQWVSEGRVLCDPFDPVGWRLYGSYDHGWNNPAAFHVHAVSPDGDIATLWECYADQVPLSALARIIHGAEATVPNSRAGARIDPARRTFPGNPFAGQLAWIVADPSIWAENQPLKDEPNKSVADLFLRSKPSVVFQKGERGADVIDVGEVAAK